MVYIMTVVGGVWNHEGPVRRGLAGRGPGHLLPVEPPTGPSGASILFGGLLILYLRMPIDLIPDQIYKILPYVVTVVVLIFTSLRNNRDSSRLPALVWRISAKSGKHKRRPYPGRRAFLS